MSRTIFRGASELHGFFMAVLAVSAAIVIAAIPIPIRVSIMIPIATSTLITLVITIPVVVAARLNLRRIHHKICAAATIHPNSLLIESPSLTLSTDRLASLSL
jgi:hypothetical protein